ncbi:hypothetical protein QQS21_011605 [Conoideocrella luteorostrata]|uniref:Uncharacterized protein n=1 Tax=Conoideocrella luteorostrata TaxID=1105319 RepID=A0AAJ0FN85_9HYPO|nr:hypothetical protein QQS21_011605 [Conoideocrella luteorostrata]
MNLSIPVNSKAVDNKYIIKLKTNSTAVDNVTSSMGVTPYHKFTHASQGFAARLTDEQLKKLNNDPNVERIEKDEMLHADFYIDEGFAYEDEDAPDEDAVGRAAYGESNTKEAARGKRTARNLVPRTSTKYSKNMLAQEDAPWNLARISHRERHYTNYTYDKSAGTGVCVYVLDSGINTGHRAFGGRAKFVKDLTDEGTDDNNGHGTHVAGIIGSSSFGVAKNATLYAVKILRQDGHGASSLLVAGMDFVLTDAPTRFCPRGIVVNVSVGNPHSKIINKAANRIVRAGYFLAVSAGNYGHDAKTRSPASASLACTAAATTFNDELDPKSNFGYAVNVLAPGIRIKSTWKGQKFMTQSGTSMASAHVAGLGAYYMGLYKNLGTICSFITRRAAKNLIKMGASSGTPNRLINNRRRGEHFY